MTGHRILLIGHDVGAAAEDLKERNPASLTIVEMDDSVVERTSGHGGDVHVTMTGAAESSSPTARLMRSSRAISWSDCAGRRRFSKD